MKRSTMYLALFKMVWGEARPFVGLILMVGFLGCLYEVHPYALGAWICYRYGQTFMEEPK